MSSPIRIHFREAMLAGVLIALPVLALADHFTTAPAATQPIVVGRDTPAGAMNAWEQAIDRGDFATTADSWNYSARLQKVMAYKMISPEKFYRALVAQFGKQAADVCRECELTPLPRHHYVPEEWVHPPGEPNIVYGKHQGDTFIPMMERGADGIWRIGRILHLRPASSTQAAAPIAARDAADQRREMTWENKFNAVIAGVEAKKYPTTAAVIHALYPQGSPMAQQRAAEKGQEEYDAAEKRKLLAAHFDPSTVHGAIGAYLQAWMRGDAAGMAKFFYASDDLKGRLAQAKAERIVSTKELQDAVNSHIADSHGAEVIGEFESPLDAPWWADVQQHGATATGTFEGGQTVCFRDINGIWKEDVTSPVPSARRAVEMKHDNDAIHRITADILAGKIKTLAQVRAVVQAADLQTPRDH